MPRYSQDQREKALSETRQRLLQAAMDEFAHQGYTRANINRISESAGLAKGTVYNYFSSKQALMLTLIAEVGKSHLDFIAGQICQEIDAAKRLERFYSAGFAFVEDHPVEARFLITTLYGAETEFKQAMFLAYRPMFKLVGEEILAVGIAQGIFRSLDVPRTAALLMTIYLGTSSNVDEHDRVFLKANEVTEFVLNSMRLMDRNNQDR
jgi:AcrR family transcriptional regulator